MESEARQPKGVVGATHLSHGTLMCRNLVNSRRFYEEFLGLEVVRHARPAMVLRLNSSMYVVRVCIGERAPAQHVLTHWGLNVGSREELDRVYAAALRLKDEYGIRKINKVMNRRGAYASYLVSCIRHCVSVCMLAGAIAGTPSAAADSPSYPYRPVRFIVPLPPGGSPDLLARTISSGLHWPESVVVENRTSGGRNLAAELVAKSAPDGYTWLLTTDNILTANPHLGKTPFDPFKDFTPVTLLARLQFLLVVHPSVPAKSVQELIALAKAKPGSLNYGSSGNGSAQHLGTAMLQHLAGIELNHVPYKGAGPAMVDLLPGRIQVWIGAANSLLPHIREGKLRLLGSAGAQRYPTLPDVPTIAESGVPGYSHAVWAAVTMPAKVPPAVVAKVNADIATVVNAPEVKARLATLGIEVATSTPQELARLIRDDYARWGKIMRATGIKAD